MKVKLLTLYPEIFPGFLGYSVTGKALSEGKWSFETINIRDYAFDKYGSVDDTPCGGGAGMVMRADVLGAAIKNNYKSGKLIYMSPRGKPLTQEKVHELAKHYNYTDDSSMVEELSIEKVYVVEGEIGNIKYTRKEDF